MGKDRTILFWHYAIASALVIIGVIIYALFRSDIIFLNVVSGQHEGILSLWAVQHSSSPLVYFVVYCLPDAMWYAALLLTQYPMRSMGLFNSILYWVGVAIPFALEGLQHFKLIPGTFDVADIITYILTYIIILQCLKQKSLQLRR